MSTRDLHEYTPGQFQTVTRLYQEPAGDDPKVILDGNRVKLAAYDIELWSDVGGWVQLIIGTDYTLQFRDEEVSTTEGVDIYGGYLILNAAYQTDPLYLTGKIVGGYTFRPYRPQAITLTVGGTIPMSVISDMAVIADTTAASMTLTLPDLSGDPLADNCQITIIPKGPNIVTVTAPTLPGNVVLKDQAGQFIWGGGWLPVGSAGGGGGGGGGMAIGEVVWWPGSGSPDASKLVCDGTIYNITDYPSLFGKLGTLYGGDGVTTFGVPNLSGITPGAFGSQIINGGVKGDATAIGGIREDQLQEHQHYIAATIEETVGTPITSHVQQSTTSNSGANETNLAGRNIKSGRAGTYTRSTELVGRWVIQAYDTVQEVPGDPAIIKDWVLVWSGTPTLTVPNAWGEGVFLIGFQYTYNAATIRSNVVMGILIDGFEREVLFDVDQAGGNSFIRGKYLTDNRFTLVVGGTDFTNPLIRGIYKFDDAAPAEVVLNPPSDGWETIWTGLANTVPNTWGSGTYEFTVTGFLTNDFNVTCNLAITEDAIATGDDVRSSSFTQWDGTEIQTLRVDWDAQTNLFTALAVVGLTPGLAQIMRIRKFNGLLHVLHDYKNSNVRVYDNYTNTGHVTNTWGDGVFRLILRAFNNSSSGQSTLVVDNTSVITDTFVGSNTGGSGAGVTTAYYKVDNTFRCTYTTTAWYIAEIWKLS